MLIKTVSPFDLHNAYAGDHCPICALNDRDERRYIDTMLYDQVTNVQWRGQIRAARGFCAPHTTRILDEGRSALGVALIAEDVLKTLREQLEAGSPQAPSAWGRLIGSLNAGSRSLAARLRRTAPCPLCAHLRQQTPVHLRSLLQDLETAEGRRAYQSSAGLCVPHLVATLDTGEPAGGVPIVVERQLTIWRQLEAELQEFIRKNDYQFTGEPIGAERDAWRRAYRLLAGWQLGQDLRS